MDSPAWILLLPCDWLAAASFVTRYNVAWYSILKVRECKKTGQISGFLMQVTSLSLIQELNTGKLSLLNAVFNLNQSKIITWSFQAKYKNDFQLLTKASIKKFHSVLLHQVTSFIYLKTKTRQISNKDNLLLSSTGWQPAGDAAWFVGEISSKHWNNGLHLSKKISILFLYKHTYTSTQLHKINSGRKNQLFLPGIWNRPKRAAIKRSRLFSNLIRKWVRCESCWSPQLVSKKKINKSQSIVINVTQVLCSG